MAIAFVREAASGDNGSSAITTITLTIGAAGAAAGDLLVVYAVMGGSRTLSSISDSKGNTWAIDQTLNNTTNHGAALATSLLATALVSGDTITLTWNGTGRGAAIALEFSGVTGGVDVSAAAAATSSSYDSGLTGTSAGSNALIIGVVTQTGALVTVTPESLSPAWIEQDSISSIGSFTRSLHALYRIVGDGPTTYAAKGSLASSLANVSIVGVYKAAGGGTDVTVTPARLDAVFALNAPTVTATQIVTLTPARLNASFALGSPTVSAVQNVTVSPARLDAVFALGTVTVTSFTSVTVTPAVLGATFALGSETVITTRSVTVAPASLDATFVLYDPTVSTGGFAVVMATTLGATFALNGVTVATTQSPTVAADRVDAAFALLGPAVVVDAAPAPAQLNAVFALGAPTVVASSSATIAADRLDAAFAIVRPAVKVTVIGTVRRPPVEYVVEIFDPTSSFGPGVKQAEVWDARNIRWARYDRLPGSAVFTLYQSSPHLARINPPLSHVRITRVTPNDPRTVWEGTVIEPDATGDDVVLNCADYLALLALSRAGYQTDYSTKKVGTEIVAPEWALARGATSSILGFVTTGAIEDPVGTDGTTIIKTNDQFGTMDQHRLRLFYDLSEMCRANTDNVVSFEITLDDHVFTFLKNKGSDRSDIGLVLNGSVSDYRYLRGWTAYRNDLASVAIGASGGSGEIVKTDPAAITAKGLRQGLVTIPTLLGVVGGTTESDQQAAALARELVKSTTLTPAVGVVLVPGALAPFDGWDICDRLGVEIVNGNDSLTDPMRVEGIVSQFTDQGEQTQLVLQPVAP